MKLEGKASSILDSSIQTTADMWLCHVMMVRARPKVVLSISTCALSYYLFQVKNIYFFQSEEEYSAVKDV